MADAATDNSAILTDAGAILAAAAATSAACTLSLDGPGFRASRRGRLGQVSATEVRLIISGSPTAAAEASAAWRMTGVSATVCVRFNEQDNVFFSRVISVTALPDSGTSSLSEVEVVLAVPTQVIATRRRANYRVPVSEADAIGVRLWRIDQYAVLRDQPPPSKMFKCSLCDLSADGMRALVLAGRIKALGFVEGLRFRIELTSDDLVMIFDARLRHPRATPRDAESAYCGFEFIHDDDEIESRRNRQKLDTTLAKLQRSAARREAA